MFQLTECPKCGSQDLTYYSGTNKKGFWEGYKCKNVQCKVMTFDKGSKAQFVRGNAPAPQQAPQGASSAQKSQQFAELLQDIKEIKHDLEQIKLALNIPVQIQITPSDMKPDDDLPF